MGSQFLCGTQPSPEALRLRPAPISLPAEPTIPTSPAVSTLRAFTRVRALKTLCAKFTHSFNVSWVQGQGRRTVPEVLAATSRFGTNARSPGGEVAMVTSSFPQHTRKGEGVWDPKKVYPNPQVMACRQQLWRGLATEGGGALLALCALALSCHYQTRAACLGFRGTPKSPSVSSDLHGLEFK